MSVRPRPRAAGTPLQQAGAFRLGRHLIKGQRRDPPKLPGFGGPRLAQRATCEKRVMPERVMPRTPPAAVVSPLGASGGKATRGHHLRVRSQRSERLQFPALSPPIKQLEGANRRAANLVRSGVLAEKEAIPIPCLRKSGRTRAPLQDRHASVC